jgi:5-formyltetrahydrofolate cyclo-ligase
MSGADHIEAEKAALRRLARERRTQALKTQGAAAARRLAAHGIDFLRPSPQAVVSGYISLPDEIQTGPILAWLHAEGYRLAMPVMQGSRKPLLFRAWTPGDEMQLATWGIAEPLEDKPVLVPDILLVPLLAFDAEGWRVGYGGGYFDRTLHMLRASGRVAAVGIALDELEVDAVPHLDYDEPLDWVLTPSGPRRLGAGEPLSPT